MKYFYIAVQVCENGKWYAYAVKISETDNLLHHMERIANAKTANICPSKKAAAAAVASWNALYKTRGVYMFDDAPLF